MTKNLKPSYYLSMISYNKRTIERAIAEKREIVVASGEGDIGSGRDVFTGATVAELSQLVQDRLAGGDRWAKVYIDGQQI